jgi:hypothetical protein
MSDNTLTRRQVLGSAGAVIAGSSFAQAQQGPTAAPGTAKPAAPAKPRLTIDSGPRMAPVNELVLVSEFEDSARLTLPGGVFSTISGTDHRAFDRITVRPRMIGPTLDMEWI